MWLLEAQAHHAEGGCFVLTNHPFISGRPSKAAALERLIEDVRALDGMWVTTLGEIAEHAAATVEEVRRIARIDSPAGYFDRTGQPRGAAPMA
jgi:peptidoglycan-N-acetylglucosamine deacetylase